jgi:imidazolonepropionase-like amidohydrolase
MSRLRRGRGMTGNKLRMTRDEWSGNGERMGSHLTARRLAASVLCLLGILMVCAAGEKTSVPEHKSRIVIAAKRLLDGRGHVLPETRIVVEGSKIVQLNDQKRGQRSRLRRGFGAASSEQGTEDPPIDYDLRGFTVMPGWIDSHVHITWSFGPNGKNQGADETTQFAAYQSASNAWFTLMAGFTTVQSVGSPMDVPLRDAIAKGEIPGPRILTAVQPLEGRGEKTGTPDEIRAFVRKQKAAGADLIKIFASESIRKGGGMTLSQDQLNAACDEANKQGLRTLVHAYKEAVRAAAALKSSTAHWRLTPISKCWLSTAHIWIHKPVS